MDKEVAISRSHCIRCGECCLSSSPTLQTEDVSLVKDGFIAKRHLYTIRVGELVRDNINEKLAITEKEIIKIKEKKDGKGCIYYDEEGKACVIYDHRPLQCAALACWDSSEFMMVYNMPKAARKDIIGNKTQLNLVAHHEKKCSYQVLEECVKQIKAEGEKAIEKIIELLKFDYYLRPFVSKKLDIEAGELDLFFGQSLIDTITMFGLKVVKQTDGSFFLTTLESLKKVR